MLLCVRVNERQIRTLQSLTLNTGRPLTWTTDLRVGKECGDDRPLHFVRHISRMATLSFGSRRCIIAGALAGDARTLTSVPMKAGTVMDPVQVAQGVHPDEDGY